MSQERSNQASVQECLLCPILVNLIHPRTLLIYSLHLLWFCADRLGTVVHFLEFHDKTSFSDSEAPHLARQRTMGIWSTNVHCTLALSIATMAPLFCCTYNLSLGAQSLVDRAVLAVLTKAKSTQDPRRGTFRVSHPNLKKKVVKTPSVNPDYITSWKPPKGRLVE